MERFTSRSRQWLILCIMLLMMLTPTLAACGGSATTGARPPATAVTRPTPTATEATTIPTPGVRLGAQPCPASVSDPAHWAPIIGVQNGEQVERVSCANLMGNPSLQALVTVRSPGSGAFLDVYVYDDITSATPVQRFKLQGLDKGDAKISGYNTIITAEVDANSSINKGQPAASLTPDLCREFKWSASAGAFVQVSFPGLFPDITRYQAEADQAQVNQGHQPWKLNAIMTAQALAADLLKWDPNAPATLISGGGPHDATAVVSVHSTSPGNGTITVTLNRLEGNTNGGIWEVIAVAGMAGMSITAPPAFAPLTSPITVTGTGNAFEGQVGKVIVLDHLYTVIGQVNATGTNGMGNTPFTVSVPYTSTFQNGSEEAILALYAYSQADGSIASAVMQKELLGA
jgi:hypothetical protein